MPIPEKVKAKLRNLPAKPGCYLMRDRAGRIIYIGKAASLRQRVRSYFHRAVRRRADPKLRSLVNSIADFDILVLNSETAAILTEGRLIKEYRPRYNVLFRDDKRFPILRVDVQTPFPRFTLCRFQRNDGAIYLGPYASSAAARAALEFVEKRCGLRKCSPLIPGLADHKHCLDDILRYCAAPCLGQVSAVEYRRRVEEAIAFLRGERPAVLKELAAAMETAAQALDFEKAAALRDTLRLLQVAIRQRAGIVRRAAAPEPAGLTGIRALQSALKLARLPRRIEAYDISNISGTHAVGSLVVAQDGVPRPTGYRRYRIKTLSAADDAGMLAEVVRRRFGRLQREHGALPDLVLVDGGLAQLRAARQELARLDLTALPVAGLAKRFEELYWEGQGRAAPLRLPADSPALKVLQQLRDEAHRFALAYHRRLRAKRIRESALDEIPGVGARRKEQLLCRFGSVARLTRAPESAIAATAGVGPQLARVIKQALILQRGSRLS